MCTHCDILERASPAKHKALHSLLLVWWLSLCVWEKCHICRWPLVTPLCQSILISFTSQLAFALVYNNTDSARKPGFYFLLWQALILINPNTNPTLFTQTFTHKQYIWHAHRCVGYLPHLFFHTIKVPGVWASMAFIKLIVPDCS